MKWNRGLLLYSISILIMHAILEIPSSRIPISKRSVKNLVSPLYRLTDEVSPLVASAINFHSNEGSFSIPRFVFHGPHTDIEPLKIGIFAGIHGDEPEGSAALVEFLEELVRDSNLARGYQIFAYPVCNPTGYEANTRVSRRGKDLNREFWKSSEEPEVFFLEHELWEHSFDGIISLHGDDTSGGLYGFVRGPDMSEELLKPALLAAEKILPRNRATMIDGFGARNGIIEKGYRGILSAPPGSDKTPFEIVFETPTQAPMRLQIEAVHLALRSILEEHRLLISVAQNI